MGTNCFYSQNNSRDNPHVFSTMFLLLPEGLLINFLRFLYIKTKDTSIKNRYQLFVLVML